MTDTQIAWKGGGMRWLLDAFPGQKDLEISTAKINSIPDSFKCLH